MSGKRFSRVLVTNDDGIDAPGLVIAEEIAHTLADEVWVVAPERDCSGLSRMITIQAPLRLTERSERRFMVQGSPADCAVMGVGHVLKDTPPDLVLSGVNSGANIAGEVHYSGTFGAAFTARLLGVPAIALSQAYRSRKDVPWDTARKWLPQAVEKIISSDLWPTPYVMNVNAPAVGPDEVIGIEATRQGSAAGLTVEVEERTDRRERDYYWYSFNRKPEDISGNSDKAALKRGAVSVAPIGFDQTEHSALEQWADALK